MQITRAAAATGCASRKKHAAPQSMPASSQDTSPTSQHIWQEGHMALEVTKQDA